MHRVRHTTGRLSSSSNSQECRKGSELGRSRSQACVQGASGVGRTRGLQGRAGGWTCGSPCKSFRAGISGALPPATILPGAQHPTLSNSTMTSCGGNQGQEGKLPPWGQAGQNTCSGTLSVVLGRDAGEKTPIEALGFPGLRLILDPSLPSWGSGQHGA